MEVLAVIPARFESVRFPGKALLDLKGKTMIERVYNQISKANSITSITVATDDERIYHHCINVNVPVVMTSTSHQSGTDRVAEVAGNSDADWVLNVQGDEPLLPSKYLDKLVNAIANEHADIATLAAPIQNLDLLKDPNTVKVVKRTNGQALYFSRSGIPYQRNLDTRETTYWQHMGVYAFSKQVLLEIACWPKSKLELQEGLEQLRWLEGGMEILVVEVPKASPGIDTPADVAEVLPLIDE